MCPSKRPPESDPTPRSSYRFVVHALIVALIVLFVLPANDVFSADGHGRPNVIVIMTDDLDKYTPCICMKSCQDPTKTL